MTDVTKMNVILNTVFGIFFWIVFLTCAVVCLSLVVVLPKLSWRQYMARACARAVFILTGTQPSKSGWDLLPTGPCVVVANHASYLDGVLLFAYLRNGFSFVIKDEMQHVPLAGFVLRRIGQFFVEREHVQRSARSTRQVIRAAKEGRPIGFFPEGTFTETPGLRRFRKGAFAVARSVELPVVPLVIQGTRGILPADRWLPHPGRISVEVLPIVDAPTVASRPPEQLMTEVRSAIAARLDEPDLLDRELEA
ncbi:MAG: lysophospholipid acyltransferase family protein [Pseudomonadota bacterium]